MAVELTLSETRKMFATSDDVCGSEPGNKLPSVNDRFAWVGRHCPGSHHLSRCLKCQIKHRREIDIETQRTTVRADDLPVLAEKLSISRRECLGRGRRSTEYVTKPVDRPALQVNASEKRSPDALLTVAQQSPSLFRALNVSGEQNDPRWLHSCEQGTKLLRDFRTVEADDQKLPDLFNTTSLALRLHVEGLCVLSVLCG